MRQAAGTQVLSRLDPKPGYIRSSRPALGSGGRILDERYQLGMRVGSGATATVYRGRDLLLGKEVAIKVMHEALADDEAMIERFQREAFTAEHLHHPNIVRGFDHGHYDGRPYIVMERVLGPSLKTLVSKETPLEPARAIELTLQILQAAQFIHDHGIIHRDLKPANILLSRWEQAKVTDFGIASSGATDLTPTGVFLGTVHYLSPEQVIGCTATEASDLYSIGIILYELLTGCLPFRGELLATVALQQLNERPSPPQDINRAIPAGLNAIVLRALEKAPEARIADCRTFAAALRRELGMGQIHDYEVIGSRDYAFHDSTFPDRCECQCSPTEGAI